jgi:hypothetical protein
MRQGRGLLLPCLLCLTLSATAAELTPRVHASGGIAYVSGGIGIEERQAMQDLTQPFNLRLSFSERGKGALLASAMVRIYDAADKLVLDVASEGPLLFLLLPEGRYRIEAEHAGIRLTKQVELGPKVNPALAFKWPSSKPQ